MRNLPEIDLLKYYPATFPTRMKDSAAYFDNEEAAALRDVLRGGGSVTRPANDKAMLALGARLSRIAQIPAPARPFEFSPRDTRWTAQFGASSAVSPAAR